MIQTKNAHLYRDLIGKIDLKTSDLTLTQFSKSINRKKGSKPKALHLLLTCGNKMVLTPTNSEKIGDGVFVYYEVLGVCKIKKEQLTIISQFLFRDSNLLSGEFYTIKHLDKVTT